jgi:hypothetical protein
MMRQRLPLLGGILLSVSLFTLGIPAFGDDSYRGYRKTETEHFVFIYEERDAESVRELLSFAEDIYDELSSYFDYRPDRIPVVLHGRIDTANGSYVPFPSHINLYITSPSAPWMGARTENWLEVLFIHELAHYLHLTLDSGFFAALSKVFGFDISSLGAGFMPGWMIEGLPVELETRLTGGGRGRNPFFEIYWKAPILEDSLFSLRRAAYSSRFPPPGRHYLAGYMIVDYMGRRFGPDILVRIHREFLKFPLLGPRYALERVTGVSFAEIYEDMESELEERYGAGTYRRPDSASATRLSDDPPVVTEGTGSYYRPRAAGGRVYFYSDRIDAHPGIDAYSPETGKIDRVVSVSLTDRDSFDVSASGETVVFASPTTAGNHPTGMTYISDLYRIDRGSRRIHRLTSGAHLLQPALSPDGNRLIAVQLRGSYTRLVEIDPDEGSLESLIEGEQTKFLNPVFSPNGSALAFAVDQRGTQRVWIYRFDTGTVRQVPAVPGTVDYYPDFTPEGELIFTSDRSGELALYLYDPDTAAVVPLKDDPVGAFYGAVSGNTLYYGTYRTTGYRILSAPFDPETEEGSVASPEALPLPELEPQVSGLTFGPRSEIAGAPRQPPPEPLPSRRYVNAPRPLVWLPVPFYVNTIAGTTPVFGLGIFSYGGSVLGGASWQIAATSRFQPAQPGIDAYFSFAVPYVNIEYSLQQAFYQDVDLFYKQVTLHSLGLSVPIINRSRLLTSVSLSLSGGLTHTFFLYHTNPFVFFDGFDLSRVSQSHSLAPYAGLSFQVRRAATDRDFFSPLKFIATLGGNFPLKLLPTTPTGIDLSNTLEFQFPSFRHQFIRLGIRNSYTSAELLGGRNAAGRGAYPRIAQQLEGLTRVSLDYLAAFALVDVPFPIGYNMFGLNLQGIAGGFHIETAAEWSLTNPQIAFDSFIYTGIEFILIVGNSLATLPVGVGLSFRFDRSFSRPVNAAEDFSLYVFVGLDSFLSTLFKPHQRGIRKQAADPWR